MLKEYEIKRKIAQELLQLKLTFLLGYNLKIFIQWEELTRPILPVGKTLYDLICKITVCLIFRRV